MDWTKMAPTMGRGGFFADSPVKLNRTTRDGKFWRRSSDAIEDFILKAPEVICL
ncbi:hypothetical protein J2TS4_51450 [Paenibacillus sp. J2TS4]|nr:hypothetical protein J2TS4_51450 [Paenibacillus sp. J2TS4]